ncbi:MAG: cysteine--tRNA ligase [Rhodospirillales bacterium]|nr:cysteine--tRNA ligase [Rhodospirillales bacterium]
MPELKLHNTLTGKKDIFTPIDPVHVRMYACGPTVYNYAHIGNARQAVVFDMLARVLKMLYPKVTYASNITDVDDKIMVRAKELNVPIDEITRKYERIYNDDMAALGVSKPDIQPRATETMPEIITLIEKLIMAGHAYEKDGHVLFNVPSYEQYGRLSGRSRDEQIAGARVEVAPYKKDPADFVLWKPSSADQPGWDSPWGYGRPGWHIECSAMSEKFLGLPFDIHGGGADLKFPHHENEMAQSCCAHGHETDITAFAKYWVHNGFLTMSGTKMSKSLGNIALIHELLEDHQGEVLRLALLAAHYRQPLDWGDDTIAQSKSMLDRLYNVLKDLADVPASPDAGVPESFMDALCDDLNTPKAIAVLNALAKEAASERTPELKGQLLAAAKLFGILQEDPATWLGYSVSGDDIDAGKVEKLLRERTDVRAAKNFARADEIRDELTAMGVVIEDTPDGPKWRRVS